MFAGQCRMVIMKENVSTQTFVQLEFLARNLLTASNPKPIPARQLFGDEAGDQPIMQTDKIKFADGGILTINVVEPGREVDFDWKVELTYDRRESEEYWHVLLLKDATLAEAYGKEVTPLDETAAIRLFNFLRSQNKA